ncbi:MAG: iron ABC transporter substrate-binding protein, partial [Actinobacteria bacterium]|nr:iron ABC transporter substrate-binding protein [Actinomycetota bacterium]
TTALTASGVGPAGSPAEVTVYSGRSESLVKPLLAQFEQATGIVAKVRYAGSAELAATILEEGSNSPADVFFSQDAGALGAVQAAGHFGELPAALLDRVEPVFRSRTGRWVGVSGRARVLTYNTDQVKAAELPASVAGLATPAWKGRLGWAPTNASFQAFVTGMRLVQGDDQTLAWLRAMLANAPRNYSDNTPLVNAVIAGEIHAGLTNHYYLMRSLKERGAVPATNYFFPAGDPGALINVAGAGLLRTARNQGAGVRFVAYILSGEAQAFFAEQTFEYPLVKDAPAPAGLPTLASLQPPNLDLSALADLKGTVGLLQSAGVL